ncbi:MAG: hypothetical protein JRJ04_19170, partial [Deltaproteobacteria bacterium]|nr:hypothetical protein [Deltaproteobacteria bacterium]
MEYQVLFPKDTTFERLTAARPLLPFSESVMTFVAALSTNLLRNAECRKYPELPALGYWLRPANLRKLKQRFVDQQAGDVWLPRGLVFHLAPSNVPTIAVYSWICSLLMGNCNLIRLSGKQNNAQARLVEIINEALSVNEHAEIKSRNLLVSYPHNEKVTAMFSECCQARVIWGGDETVKAIRRIPLPANAKEICFANRISLALLDARAVLNLNAQMLEQLAHNFFNDAYGFNQMACSSPRLVVWLGKQSCCEAAKERFWKALQNKVEKAQPVFSAGDYMNKLVVRQ